MTAFNINKVTALPSSLVANSIYIVSTGAPLAEIYVTGTTATDVRRVINTADVQGLIDTSLSNISAMEIVDDIADRDALSLSANALVLVLDATADTTVSAGAATYAYRHSDTSFTKISEAESQDVILQWANITGGPTSTPSQIDSAVTASHGHSNKTELDEIGQDSNGNMTYSGSLPVTGWATANW